MVVPREREALSAHFFGDERGQSVLLHQLAERAARTTFPRFRQRVTFRRWKRLHRWERLADADTEIRIHVKPEN
jgi:hypothetical protein